MERSGRKYKRNKLLGNWNSSTNTRSINRGWNTKRMKTKKKKGQQKKLLRGSRATARKKELQSPLEKSLESIQSTLHYIVIFFVDLLLVAFLLIPKLLGSKFLRIQFSKLFNMFHIMYYIRCHSRPNPYDKCTLFHILISINIEDYSNSHFDAIINKIN